MEMKVEQNEDEETVILIAQDTSFIRLRGRKI
jgi:hypothetical protein